ncbi:hypothetical protein KAT08_00280 [Candidatus Babeliales bacterium]|nr:hypothetical protein [Candidatus Babeliales bacterium]
MNIKKIIFFVYFFSMFSVTKNLPMQFFRFAARVLSKTSCNTARNLPQNHIRLKKIYEKMKNRYELYKLQKELDKMNIKYSSEEEKEEEYFND